MIDKNKKSRSGKGLILAGGIVLFVGLAIVLFKELNIPRYWIPAVVGLALIAAGAFIRGISGVGCGRGQHDS